MPLNPVSLVARGYAGSNGSNRHTDHTTFTSAKTALPGPRAGALSSPPPPDTPTEGCNGPTTTANTATTAPLLVSAGLPCLPASCCKPYSACDDGAPPSVASEVFTASHPLSSCTTLTRSSIPLSFGSHYSLGSCYSTATCGTATTNGAGPSSRNPPPHCHHRAQPSTAAVAPAARHELASCRSSLPLPRLLHLQQAPPPPWSRRAPGSLPGSLGGGDGGAGGDSIVLGVEGGTAPASQLAPLLVPHKTVPVGASAAAVEGPEGPWLLQFLEEGSEGEEASGQGEEEEEVCPGSTSGSGPGTGQGSGRSRAPAGNALGRSASPSEGGRLPSRSSSLSTALSPARAAAATFSATAIAVATADAVAITGAAATPAALAEADSNPISIVAAPATAIDAAAAAATAAAIAAENIEALEAAVASPDGDMGWVYIGADWFDSEDDRPPAPSSPPPEETDGRAAFAWPLLASPPPPGTDAGAAVVAAAAASEGAQGSNSSRGSLSAAAAAAAVATEAGASDDCVESCATCPDAPPRKPNAAVGGNKASGQAQQEVRREKATAGPGTAFGYCLGSAGGGTGGGPPRRPERRPCNRGYMAPAEAETVTAAAWAALAALGAGAGGGGGTAAAASLPLVNAATDSWTDLGVVPRVGRRTGVMQRRNGRTRNAGGGTTRMLVTETGYGNGRYGNRDNAAGAMFSNDDEDDLAAPCYYGGGTAGAVRRVRQVLGYGEMITAAGGGAGGGDSWRLSLSIVDTSSFRVPPGQILTLSLATMAAAAAQRDGAATASRHHRQGHQVIVSLADGDWDSLWSVDGERTNGEPLASGWPPVPLLPSLLPLLEKPLPLPPLHSQPHSQPRVRQSLQLPQVPSLTRTWSGGALLDLPDGWEAAMAALIAPSVTRRSPVRIVSPLLSAAGAAEKADETGCLRDSDTRVGVESDGARVTVADGGVSDGGSGGGDGGRTVAGWRDKLRAGLGGLLRGFTRCYSTSAE